MAPMDMLLTQLYGILLVLNMFGIIVCALTIFQIEFKGDALRKLCMLPVSLSKIFFSKWLLLTILVVLAIGVQNIALWIIGILLRFTGYSFVTALPVLSFMLLISSRLRNMWLPLG